MHLNMHDDKLKAAKISCHCTLKINGRLAENQMQSYESVYRASYWNYENPFGVKNDPYEDLVNTRVQAFGAKKPAKKKQMRDFNAPRPRKGQIPADAPKPKPTRAALAVKSQMKKTNGQTFVSSDTKPLKITPRINVHLPTPVARVVTYDESSAVTV